MKTFIENQASRTKGGSVKGEMKEKKAMRIAEKERKRKKEERKRKKKKKESLKGAKKRRTTCSQYGDMFVMTPAVSCFN